MRLFRALLTVLVGVPLFLSGSSASARGLEYLVPAGCPSRAQMEAKIAARAPEGRDARVEVRAVPAGFHGEVMLGEGEERVVRTVEARTCAATVDALALVIALDRQEPSGPDESGSDSAAEDATIETAPRTEAVAPTSTKTTERADTEAPRPPNDRAITGSSGLVLSTSSFTDGELAIGGAFYGQFGSRRGILGLDWLRPVVRASGFRAETTSWTERGDIEPSFSFLGGMLDLCPLGLGSGPSLSVAACSHTELASLSATARGPLGNERGSESRLWLATGAVIRARYVIVDPSLRLFQPVFEIGGGLVAPLIRDRFHFPGHDPITADRLLWTASIGVGVEVR